MDECRLGDRFRSLAIVSCVAVWAAVTGAAAASDASAPQPPDFFAAYEDDEASPEESRLRELLEPVQGEPFEIGKDRRRDREMHRVMGFSRLKAGWPAGMAVRFSFWEIKELVWHVWNGNQGVSFRYYPEFNQAWAAYATSREGSAPRPARWVFAGGDGDRYRRSGIGTAELHFVDGRLIMTRGDLQLLSVPFAGPPDEVYLELNAYVRGLDLVPSAIPPAPLNLPPKPWTPARLNWQLRAPDQRPQDPPGYTWAELPDGTVELKADARARSVFAATEIGEPEFREYLFEVENATPGTGVFLADRDGKERARVAFFRHQQSGETTFGLQWPGANDVKQSVDDRRQIVPRAGDRRWLRLVMAAGVVKCWTSLDGLTWSQTSPTSEGWEGSPSQAGIYCCAADEPRSIRLKSLAVRPLPILSTLVPDSLVRAAPTLNGATDAAALNKLVADSKPPDVPPHLWRRACLVRALVDNGKQSMSQSLLDDLIEDVVETSRDAEFLVRFLTEVALIHSLNRWEDCERYERHWERLGKRLVRLGHPSPFAVVSPAMLRTDFWHGRRLSAFPSTLLRYDLFRQASQENWAAVSDYARQMLFWNRRSHEHSLGLELTWHVVEWAEAQAAIRAPEHRASRRPISPLWQDGLAEHLSKEGYNTLTELHAALEGQAYREAAQIMGTAAQNTELGLLPDRRDPRLTVSLPLAFQQAIEEHPALRAEMEESFGAVGSVRLSEAAVAGDAERIAAITIQLYGTTAAASAHQWLGDRALARGNFAAAMNHFEQALRGAPPAQQADILARKRLAAAYLGDGTGLAVKSGARVGTRSLAAVQIEELVSQIHQRCHKQEKLLPETCPKPGEYTLQPWARIDGSRVKRAGGLPDRGLDWAARQSGVVIVGNRMIVNNQVDQVALDLASGRQAWIQQPSLEDKDQQWPLVVMKPVARGERVYVRRLARGGPEIACLEMESGRLLWTAKPDSHVVSDPLFIGDELFVLSCTVRPGERLTLALVRLDGDTGTAVERWPIADFQDLSNGRLHCPATVADRRIIVAAAGHILCCDGAGRLVWLRRQTWIRPPGSDYSRARWWMEQYHSPPLALAGAVYVLQPGSWDVECINLETGGLRWRRTLVEPNRLVGIGSGRLLVETGAGLEAMDAAGGELLWHRDLVGVCGIMPGQDSRNICCATLVKTKEGGKPPRLELVWLDGASGTAERTAAVDLPDWPEPLAGPFIAAGERMWGLFADQAAPAQREIRQLALTDE